MRIVLSKPIPPEGRKPTAKECEQFRKQNIQPTTSGSWRVGWCDDKGIQRPFISYFEKRTNSGFSYYFEIIESPVDVKPTTTKPTKPSTRPVAILAGNGKGPETGQWFW